jgi:predicted DNA binding CopG/RHH family protein
MEKDAALNIRLSASDLAALRRLADADGRSTSDVVRRLIQSLLRRKPSAKADA